MKSHDIKDQSEISYDGFFRAQVIEVDIDGNNFGAVKVFVPDLQVQGIIPSNNDEGLIAYPANNPVGGYSGGNADCHYQQTVYVPLMGAWVWIFFERGNPNKPFYFAAFNYQQAPVPPENRGVSQPHKVYTVLKTHEGRSIIVCDSPDQQRVEITGKRRQMGGGPAGSDGSYNIDGNMNTILLDERPGSEKLLIRTRKGDYINIDIKRRRLNAYFKDDITIHTEGNLHIKADKGINISSAEDLKISTEQNTHIVSGESAYLTQEGGQAHILSSGTNNIDGSDTLIQTGTSQSGTKGELLEPIGDR